VQRCASLPDVVVSEGGAREFIEPRRGTVFFFFSLPFLLLFSLEGLLSFAGICFTTSPFYNWRLI
jgi:hypothetical protein